MKEEYSENYRRWYDKDPILSKSMSTLEKSDDETQIKVALNLIKIIIEHNISEHTFTSVEDMMTSVEEGLVEKGKSRWYDLDTTVRTAINMLENSPVPVQKAVAREMAKEYQYSKPIDTIVCMDGCEIIGACLAEELNKNGIMSLNQHDSLYVITPEFDGNGQMIFRDNLQPMVRGKNILLLLASATTGRTIARSLECIQYYGGIIQGISAIFSAAKEIYGEPVHCIFSTEDLPDYNTFTPSECPHCKNKEKIDIIDEEDILNKIKSLNTGEKSEFDDLLEIGGE